MGWIIFLALFIISFFTYITKRDITHPVFIMSVSWLVVVLMYLLPGQSYYGLTNLAAVILILFFLIFPVGCYLGTKYKFTFFSRHHEDAVVYELRTSIYIILCLVSIAILLYNDIIIIQNLVTGLSFQDLARLGIGTSANTGYMAYIFIFVVYPIVTIASPVCAVEIFSDNPQKKTFLFINVVLVALSVLDHGGRVQLFNMVVCYIVAALLYGKKFNLSKKQKRRILLLVGIIAVLIVVLSVSRGIEDLWDSIKLYLGGSIPHMIARIEQTEFQQHTYGFLSLRGFIVPIVLVLQSLGLCSGGGAKYDLAEKLSVLMEQDAVIGDRVRTNAFLPAPYYFFIDFGIAGVIAGTLIYAAIISSAYLKVKRRPNKKNQAIYVLLVYGLVFNFIRFPFKTYQAGLGIILLCAIYRRSK